MKDEILARVDEIVDILNKDFDVLIKKTKDGSLKIMFYRPKNLKKQEELADL